jgi:predicted peptidase
VPIVALRYEDLDAKVREMARAGARGHLHTTPPGCSITGDARRAIVIEATDEGCTYAFFDDEPIEARARPLAILLHGADSVPDDDETLEPASPAVEAMAARMRDGRGHFHILNPVCLSNPQPGCWTILFEDDERGPQYSVSDTRPLADIRLIERLIYAHPKAD